MQDQICEDSVKLLAWWVGGTPRLGTSIAVLFVRVVGVHDSPSPHNPTLPIEKTNPVWNGAGEIMFPGRSS
jgi:hypothetical protein